MSLRPPGHPAPRRPGIRIVGPLGSAAGAGASPLAWGTIDQASGTVTLSPATRSVTVTLRHPVV